MEPTVSFDDDNMRQRLENMGTLDQPPVSVDNVIQRLKKMGILDRYNVTPINDACYPFRTGVQVRMGRISLISTISQINPFSTSNGGDRGLFEILVPGHDAVGYLTLEQAVYRAEENHIFA